MSDENSKSNLPETQPKPQEMTDGLNDLQRMFVAEYLTDFNATQAAIRAGYSDNAASAQVQGSRLLSNAMVMRAIRAAIDQRAERLGMNANDVLLRALKVYDMSTKGEPVMEWNGEEMVPTGEWSFDSKGANGALIIIGKALGVFLKDRGEGVDDKPGLVVNINTAPRGSMAKVLDPTRADLPVINVTVDKP